jgi:hypothetical protein
MALLFNNVAFKGVPLAFTLAAPQYEFLRTKFSGVIGVSEIAAGSGLREIAIPVVCYGGFKNRTALQQYIDGSKGMNLDFASGGGLGANGTLEYRGDNNSNAFLFFYNDCTFEGFTMRPDPGMLLDVAGTLDGGWWCFGALKFTQLTVS